MSLLLAGYDDNGPQLYQIDPSGSYFAWQVRSSMHTPRQGGCGQRVLSSCCCCPQPVTAQGLGSASSVCGQMWAGQGLNHMFINGMQIRHAAGR